MKLKMIKCDICGKNITNDYKKYKFKECINLYTYFGDQEYSNKLDMCQCCYDEFIRFVNRGELRKYKRIYCKDCKYYHPYNLMCDKYQRIMYNTDFCSYAVRSEEDVCPK